MSESVITQAATPDCGTDEPKAEVSRRRMLGLGLAGLFAFAGPALLTAGDAEAGRRGRKGRGGPKGRGPVGRRKKKSRGPVGRGPKRRGPKVHGKRGAKHRGPKHKSFGRVFSRGGKRGGFR